MKNQSVVRAYDIRGIVDLELFDEDYYHIGVAFCKIAREKLNLANDFKLTIAIGRDGRLHSERFLKYLTQGVTESGCDVLDVGLVTSGMLYYSVFELGCNGGIMITASHNPKEYNGAKFILKDVSFTSEDVKKIKNSAFVEKKVLGTIKQSPIMEKYRALLKGIVSQNMKDKIVVWDCANGATCGVVRHIADDLNCRHYILYGDVDGNFPNHEADPSEAKNLTFLQEKVHYERADIGFAFDGDGDRIGIVSSDGTIISGEEILLFLCHGIVPKYDKPKIILDVKCSPKIIKAIERLGGVPVLSKTGHAFIKQKIAEEDAILAGEMSGHIFCKDNYYGFDDGVYTAMRVIQNLEDFDDFCSSIERFKHSISQKLPLSTSFNMNEFITKTQKEFDCNFNLLDGIRCEASDFWFLVRKSNTEPILTIRLESDNKETFDMIYNYIINSTK